jgi:hypothetical protein
VVNSEPRLIKNAEMWLRARPSSLSRAVRRLGNSIGALAVGMTLVQRIGNGCKHTASNGDSMAGRSTTDSCEGGA